MTFIVRQISTTSDGRQIVRPATHEAREIGIGRDAANEIHLSDLAVGMHHARLSVLDSGKVRAASVSDLGFTVDGRATTEAVIDPASGGELRFGSHRLTIAKDGDAVLVSVERVEAVSDSADEKDEVGLFTLRSVMLGRRPMAWGAIGLVLAAFLIWPIWSYATSHGVKERKGFHADTMWSTGALSLAHKSLENDCQACHVKKFEAVTNETCLTCHKKDAHDHADPARIARAKAPPGWGGTVQAKFQNAFGIPEGRCVECHTEHEGGGKMQPAAQQFCADCHGGLKERLTDTKLPNASDFGTGHPQFRPAITAGFEGNKRLTQRVELTGAVREDNGLKFPHDIHLSKTNGIARMAQTMAAEQGWGASLACKDCHKGTADGVRFQPVEMEENCSMCHSLAFDRIGGTIRTLRHGEPDQVVADLRAFYRSTVPQRPINLSGMARRRPGEYAAVETATDYTLGARAWPGRADEAIQAVFSRGGACYDCHTVTPVGGSWSVRKVVQPARYMTKGWFDHKAHDTEDCASCHKAGTSRAATDLLIPDLKSCRTCHVGGDGATLASVRKPVESSCAMCHDYHFDGSAPWLAKQPPKRSPTAPKPDKIAALRK